MIILLPFLFVLANTRPQVKKCDNHKENADVNLMELAIDEAILAVTTGDGGPFGAIVVKDGRVVARGHNNVLSETDPTAHAEVSAIRNACKKLGTVDLSGTTLYTSGYPCPMCMGAILWANFDAIYYAATLKEQEENTHWDVTSFYEFLKNPKSDSKRILEHLPTHNSAKPFLEWQKIANQTGL